MFLGFHKLKECQGLVEEEKEVATIRIISSLLNFCALSSVPYLDSSHGINSFICDVVPSALAKFPQDWL